MSVPASTGWHHLAIVRQGTGANGLAFYVDGALSTTGNSDGVNPDTSAPYNDRWLTDKHRPSRLVIENLPCYKRYHLAALTTTTYGERAFT